MLSGHNGMKLQINKIAGKFLNIWRLHNTQIVQGSNKKIYRKISILKWGKMKIYQNVWDAVKAVLWGTHPTKCLYYKRRNITNKNLQFSS